MSDNDSRAMSPSRGSRRPYRSPTAMEHVEDVQNYVVGGYHPVNIGDWLGDGDKQFKVLQKLGSGGFSTVWLTKSSTDQRHYALKVMCADLSHNRELEVMHQLEEQKANHPNINTALDLFNVKGPNGTHACEEVTSGLAFLHEQGICHGDLTSSNILFELPGVQDWTETQVRDVFGRPKTAELRLRNGSFSKHGPREVVQNLRFDEMDESLLGSVRIIDFGSCFDPHKPPDGLGIPLPYFAPEVCFGYAPSTKSDIWALACIIFEVQAWRFLAPMYFQTFEILIGTLRFTLGPLPSNWKNKYLDIYASEALRGKGAPEIWFDENRTLRWPFVPLIHEKAPHLSPDEKEKLLHLLRTMLSFEPSQRISARDVLNHPWMCQAPSEEVWVLA